MDRSDRLLSERYKVRVDTTDVVKSKRHAGLLRLKYEEVDGEQWPALELRGPKGPLVRFLAYHLGSAREAYRYFEDNALLTDRLAS